jgi:hypothetical protein
LLDSEPYDSDLDEYNEKEEVKQDEEEVASDGTVAFDASTDYGSSAEDEQPSGMQPFHMLNRAQT